MIASVLLLAAVVIAGTVSIVMVRRREPDTLTAFRRQIDALSAESRRTVISGSVPEMVPETVLETVPETGAAVDDAAGAAEEPTGASAVDETGST